MSQDDSRRRGLFLAAAMVAGLLDVLDFLIPLWAGPALGVSPTTIGLVVGLELVCSFLARPVAGWLVDTRVRTRVAACGAFLIGLSCLGYATATGVALAAAAAAVGGIGVALTFNAVPAIVSEWLDQDDGVFARLFSAEATGAWVSWFVGMALLWAIGFTGVFAVMAATCFVAAGLLLRLPVQPPPAPDRESTWREHGRRLAPLLALRVLVGAGEAAIGLALLLHLQALGLQVWQIALVYLPGGVALTVLPSRMHKLVRRWGRRRVHLMAGLIGATAVGLLGLTSTPWQVAALWVGVGVAWAAELPIHQAVVTEVSAGRVGRGMSLVSNAAVLGAAVGSGVAGFGYEIASWPVLCLAVAGVLGVAAVLGPAILDALGARDTAGPEPATLVR